MHVYINLKPNHMSGFKKQLIIRAINIIKEEMLKWDVQMEQGHAVEIALAWEHGYYVRWNPKYYVRPFIPEQGDDLIIVCRGNPAPFPGPFRIMCKDVEITSGKITESVNEKIKKLIEKTKFL